MNAPVSPPRLSDAQLDAIVDTVFATLGRERGEAPATARARRKDWLLWEEHAALLAVGALDHEPRVMVHFVLWRYRAGDGEATITRRLHSVYHRLRREGADPGQDAIRYARATLNRVKELAPRTGRPGCGR